MEVRLLFLNIPRTVSLHIFFKNRQILRIIYAILPSHLIYNCKGFVASLGKKIKISEQLLLNITVYREERVSMTDHNIFPLMNGSWNRDNSYLFLSK